ncbi:glycyl-radical enzyme activating protein [Desulfovibrio sp. OttesenSCG-928-I05]|nr:glycyl-radical enzyme activating protein [Desulfovibrio sp. OttesenSCG-928-I05]
MSDEPRTSTTREINGAALAGRPETALIFHIQKGSMQDGPGIRTVVFLKGCPLRCRWCFNPEGFRFQAELRFCKNMCIGAADCGRCLDACEYGALQKAAPGFGSGIIVQRQVCRLCGACTSVCPSQAISIVGEAMHADAIVDIAGQDRDFYAASGGGITLSGGEPLARPAFAAEILRKSQERGLHTVLATSGWYDMDNPYVRESLRHTDLVLFDIKHVDGVLHRQFTSVDNSRIIENLRRLGREFPDLPIIARTPVVPGFNDTHKVIEEIALLAASIPSVCDHELLPCELVGEAKYAQFGLPHTQAGSRSLEFPLLEELSEIVGNTRG